MANLTIMRMDAVNNMRYVTLNVELKRAREARVRMWLCVKLMHLAAWIANCQVDIKATHGAGTNG